MSLQVASGAFNTGTGLSPVPVVTGYSATPTAIWLRWTGRTAAGVAVATIQAGHGVATPAASWCVFGVSQDSVSPSVVFHGMRDDACFATLDTSGAYDGIGGVTSWDANGFTFTPSDASAADLEIQFVAFFGVRAKAGFATAEPATATTSATTGVGFKGKFALIGSMGDVSSFSSPEQHVAKYDFGVGFACVNPSGTLRQGVYANGSAWGAGLSSTRQYFRSSAEVLACFNTTAAATPKCRAAFSSFDADGFTLSWNVVVGAGTRVYPYLVLEDGVFELQQFTTSVTNGATFTVTPNFRATAVVCAFSGRTAESTAGGGNAVARQLFGAAVGTGSQFASGTRETSGVNPTSCATRSNAGNCIAGITAAGGADGSAQVTSISATQITFTMTAGDSGANLGFAISFGAQTPLPDPYPQSRQIRRGAPLLPGDALPPSAVAFPPSIDDRRNQRQFLRAWSSPPDILPPAAVAPAVSPPQPDLPFAPLARRAIGAPPGDALPPSVGVFTGTGLPDSPSRAAVISRKAPPSPTDAWPIPVAAASPPPPEAYAPRISVSMRPSPAQQELPTQGQIFVVQDVSNFDPTSGTFISATITTTGRFSAIHFIVVGTHASFVPRINSSGLSSILLNYADDPSVTHDFAWHAYRLNVAPGTYSITFSYFDPVLGPTSPASVTNRGLLIREIGNASRTLSPLAVASEQSTPGSGTDAISAGTISVFARPALASAVSWATTTAAGPPSAGTGFTANASVFPKVAVDQALPEQQRVTAFSAVSGTFTHALGGVNNYDTVMALFAEAGAELGLWSVPDEAHQAVQRRIVAPSPTIDVMPAQAAAPTYLPPDFPASAARAPLVRVATDQGNAPPTTAVVAPAPPTDPPAPVAAQRRRSSLAAADAPPSPAAPPAPDFMGRVAALFRRATPRSEELPPVAAAAPTAPPDAKTGLRAWIRRQRPAPAEVLPQIGVKTGTGLPGVDGVVRPWWRRLPFFRPEELPRGLAVAALSPPFVAAVDKVRLTVEIDAVANTVKVDSVKLTIEGDD